MRKLLIMLVLLCVGLTSNAQSYTREGNTFISSTGERNRTDNTITTDFKVKESNGKEYVVYCSKSTGACFIKKISRNGKGYKKYLGEDVSRQVCSAINVEYKPRVRRNG